VLSGSSAGGARPAGLLPRAANALLGAWLVASVFLWRHWGPEGFNTLVTGLLVITVAPIAVWAPRLRFGSAFLGGWLFVTTLVLVHARRLTFFHDLALAIAILALALVPSRPWQYRRERLRA
jgi:hypothetical protein